MSRSSLAVPLLAMIALGACYPAARGGHHFLTPTVEQVATTRPETVRVRHTTRWTATDSLGRDNPAAEDMKVLGMLAVTVMLDPGVRSNLGGWAADYALSGARGPTNRPARQYYPLVRVTRPRAECTFFQPSPLPVKFLAWCPVSNLSWDATRRSH